MFLNFAQLLMTEFSSQNSKMVLDIIKFFTEKTRKIR